MSDEAGARLQIERDPPKQAELKAVATSQSSTASVRLPAHDANLDIPPNLDPRSIAALQRYAANAAVAVATTAMISRVLREERRGKRL